MSETPLIHSRHTSRSTVDRRVRVQGEPVDSYPALPPEVRRGSVLRITEVGEEILQRRCREVTGAEFGSPELSRLVDDMFRTMHVAEGAGLAANQVDVDLRLFVFDCLDEDGVRHVGHLANPVLDQPDPATRRLIDDAEGCLSVPGADMVVPRTGRTTARGFDKDGNPLVIEGKGYFARCLQHETDHVNGYLYIDRLPARARKDVLKQMQKMRDDVMAKRAANASAAEQ